MISDTPVLRKLFFGWRFTSLEKCCFSSDFFALQLESISFYAFGKENTFWRQFIEASL